MKHLDRLASILSPLHANPTTVSPGKLSGKVSKSPLGTTLNSLTMYLSRRYQSSFDRRNLAFVLAAQYALEASEQNGLGFIALEWCMRALENRAYEILDKEPRQLMEPPPGLSPGDLEADPAEVEFEVDSGLITKAYPEEFLRRLIFKTFYLVYPQIARTDFDAARASFANKSSRVNFTKKYRSLAKTAAMNSKIDLALSHARYRALLGLNLTYSVLGFSEKIDSQFRMMEDQLVVYVALTSHYPREAMKAREYEQAFVVAEQEIIQAMRPAYETP